MTSSLAITSPLQIKTGVKKTREEEKKEDDSKTSAVANTTTKLTTGVVEARQNLVKVLMDNRFKQRFCSTALNVDASLTNGNSPAMLELQDEHKDDKLDLDEAGICDDLNVSNSFTSAASLPATAQAGESLAPELQNSITVLEQLIREGDISTLVATGEHLADLPADLRQEASERPQEDDDDGDSFKAPLNPSSLPRRDSKMQQMLFQIHQEKSVQPSKVCHSLKQPKKTKSVTLPPIETKKEASKPLAPPSSTAGARALQFQAQNSILQSFGDFEEPNPAPAAANLVEKPVEDNRCTFSSQALQIETQNSMVCTPRACSPTIEGPDQRATFSSRPLQPETIQTNNSMLLSPTAILQPVQEQPQGQAAPQEPPKGRDKFSSKPIRAESLFPSQNSILITSNISVEQSQEHASGEAAYRSDAIQVSSTTSKKQPQERLTGKAAYAGKPIQLEFRNSLLQASLTQGTDSLSPIPTSPDDRGLGSGGSWDPMEEDENIGQVVQQRKDVETKKCGSEESSLPVVVRDRAQAKTTENDSVVAEHEAHDVFADADPFKDIAGWIDGGQGVEVTHSGIPIIGRSSSSAASSASPEEAGPETMRPFEILGTSADDVSCHPHVMSPPLMESLLAFVPEDLMECNYWLKYSLVRDGANLWTLLRQIRGSNSTFLAIETVDGRVFGAFVNHSWRYSVGWYGGQEAFLWKMRRSRLETTTDIAEQAIQESEVQVFPVRPGNVAVQYCSKDCLMLGRGEIKMASQPVHGKKHYGHGIYLDHSLLHGTTSSSETFGNPCLVDEAERGCRFEVSNMEVWALTPHGNVEDAKQSEMSTLFLEGGRQEGALNVMGILVGGAI